MQLIQAIIDAVPVVGRENVMKALNAAMSHEKKTHNRCDAAARVSK